MSRSREGIFPCSILGSATGNCIKYFIFDEPCADDLSTFVYNTIPLLPRLSSMTGLNGSISYRAGLGPLRHLGSLDDIVYRLNKKRAREAILRIAPQITEWDIELEVELAEPILSANYQGIKSLALSSSGFPILESDNSKYLDLLVKLPNLRSLSIAHGADFIDQDLEAPLADSVLSRSFPFATSLRSLSLDLEGLVERTTANELTFATLFPQLDNLRIRFRSNDLGEIQSESFLLPKLTSLEVVDCPFLYMDVLFSSFDLPSISSLHLIQSRIPSLRPELEYFADEIRELSKQLETYISTLRKLDIAFLVELKQDSLKHLVSLADTVNISVVSKKQIEMNRLISESEEEDDKVEQTEDCLSDSQDSETWTRSRRQMVRGRGGQHGEDKGFESTKELVDWAQERVYSCGTVDDVGLQEMRRMLEPIRDLKEWIAD